MSERGSGRAVASMIAACVAPSNVARRTRRDVFRNCALDAAGALEEAYHFERDGPQ
jgi:hypothetical protein